MIRGVLMGIEGIHILGFVIGIVVALEAIILQEIREIRRHLRRMY